MKRGIRALGFHICALVIVLWLAFAGFLTWAVARHFVEQLYYQTVFWASSGGVYHSSALSEDTPGYDSLQMIMKLEDPYLLLAPDQLLPIVLPQKPREYSNKDWFYDQWELLYGFQAATVFYDKAGNPVIKSGNYLTFHYIQEEYWDGKNKEYQGAAYIDLDKLPQGTDLGMLGWNWDGPKATSPSEIGMWAMRSTGYFVGDEFIPVTVDAAPVWDWKDLEWENQLTLEAPPDVPLETVYAWETGGIAFHYEPISYGGREYQSSYTEEKEYDSLVDCALEMTPWGYVGDLREIIFTVKGWPNQGRATDAYEYFTVTVQCCPLRYAALRLIPFYLWGSLAIGLCLWLLLRSIRNNVSLPLKGMSALAEAGYRVAPTSNWQEVRQAQECLRQAQNRVHSLQNDIQQLNASLDYAKNAEENRRQLVSNITHELKTPLAVIHGYAEGLQAGIAEEKQAYYLSTILEESEKMDAMVLEMLDMSRLEAGKVRLNTDHFSLLALSKEVLNRLAPEESRVHQIEILYSNDCMVVADEGRITQVVTNLISNALKYTPAGGNIWLRIYDRAGSARFSITNTGAHLSEEALEKIFEPFYRADPSRSDRGTGLGLPIARSIIQLHRGTLIARNVQDSGRPCLEFAFEFPLQ